MSEQGMALNVRNVPADLVFRARAKAALRRQDLREFVIDLLEEGTADVCNFATSGPILQGTPGNKRVQKEQRKAAKD